MAASEISIKDAVEDVIIRLGTWTPEGETKSIPTRRFIVKTTVGGKPFEFSFGLTKDQKQIISLLDSDSDLSEV